MAPPAGSQVTITIPRTHAQYEPNARPTHPLRLCPRPPPQDPSYPVYVDSSVILGMTGTHNGTGFDGIEYMLCRPENDFFPDLAKVGVVGWGGVLLEPFQTAPAQL